MKILVLNLGSTSSKVSVFEDEKEVFTKTVRHPADELTAFKVPAEQFDYRKDAIFSAVEAAGYDLSGFDGVVSRAGVVGQIAGGTYEINDAVLRDSADPQMGGRQPHGVGLRIANALKEEYGIPAFFVDPVSTEELSEVAKVTGFKGMVRQSRFHALNHKAVARKAALELGKPYEELNLVGVHTGGGITVAAHQKGRCVDITDCSEEGTMSMDRPGGLPINMVVDYCFKSGKSYDEIRNQLKREAGVLSYLGTTNFIEICEKKETDPEFKLIYEALAYQIAKSVGEMAAAMKFDVDGIFFTGGLVYSKEFAALLTSYVEKIAPVFVFPGEEEMLALAQGALRVLKGEETAKEYK